MSEPTKTALLLAIAIQSGIDRALERKGVTLKESACPKMAAAIDQATCHPEWEKALQEIAHSGGTPGQIARAALDLKATREKNQVLDFDNRCRFAVTVLAARQLIPKKGNIVIRIEHAKPCPKGKGHGACICVPDIFLTDQTGKCWTVADDGYPSLQTAGRN